MDIARQTEFRILYEVTTHWYQFLMKKRDSKKFQFGGCIEIETLFFSYSLASLLWQYFGYTTFNNFKLSTAVGIERFNYLFGVNGVYKESGWCFHRNLRGETWTVESVRFSYSPKNGALKVEFDTVRRNSKGMKTNRKRLIKN